VGVVRKVLLWSAVVVVTVVVVAAVGLSLPMGQKVAEKVYELLRGDVPVGPPVPIATADLSGAGPGTLMSAMTMPAFRKHTNGRAIEAARVVYHSTNGDSGKETVVSGAVFTPEGHPPSGGWPIIAFGHGTTGIDKECGPSLSDSLLGLGDIVFGLVKSGYAVAMPDYQGLGEDGVHPYTDAKTAGLNMIDAVRALRRTFEHTSTHWLAFGGSQGGGASWAADENASTYAPELNLVGAVAYSPAADVSGMVAKAQAHTLTKDQAPGLVALVETLARLHPDLNRDDYRRGSVAKNWDVLLQCKPTDPGARDRAIDELMPEEVEPANSAAADRLRQLLSKWALPQRPLSAPLSVAYGGKDTLVDAQWTTDAIARACSLGGSIVWDLQPDKGHGDVDIGPQLQWVADRFAGKPAPSDCP
jgi:alpha-beta hydrolase superfamily lysophospholipase